MLVIAIGNALVGGMKPGASGPVSQTANINFGSDTLGTFIGSGNWNHAFQNFATGAIAIKGDNTGVTLPSIRNTSGVSTGWGISITSQFGGDIVGQNTAGAYPASASKDCWSCPAGTRVFTITGLTPAHTYTFKLFCSVDTATEATSLADYVVSGASGGVTSASFNERGNTSNFLGGASGFTVVPTAGGIVTISVTLNTGHACVNVLTITD